MTKSVQSPREDSIEVTNLLLDLGNVRVGTQDNQFDAIQSMIKLQGEKLVYLAKHIGEHGLNPMDIQGVVDSGDGKYTVVEGNRRLTALKLLHSPSLADGTKIEAQIRSAANKAVNIPSVCKCIIFQTKEDANVWIRIKHYNDQKGAGTESWNAAQIRRATGKIDKSLEMLDLVIQEGHLTIDEQEAVVAPSFPITNLERLVNTPSLLEKLGVKWEKTRYLFSGDREQSFAYLTEMVREIHSGLSVTDIKLQDQRNAYGDHLVNGTPFPAGKSGTAAQASSGSGPTGNSPGASGKYAVNVPGIPASTRGQRPLRQSNLRKALIPSKFVVKIPTPRVNQIYMELRELKVEDYRNAVAVLFRLFLEFSVNNFISANHITVPAKIPKHPTLTEKIKEVEKFMKTNNLMTHNELKPIRKATSDTNNILHTENFNAFVHSKSVIPNHKELKDMWDTIEPFMQKLW